MLYTYSPSFCWHTPTPKIQKRLSRPLVQIFFSVFSWVSSFSASCYHGLSAWQPPRLGIPWLTGPEDSCSAKYTTMPAPVSGGLFDRNSSSLYLELACHYIYILVGLSPHVLSFEKPVVNAIGYGDAYQLTGSPFATLGKRCEKKCRTPSCARGSRLSYFLLAVVHCRHFGRGPSFVLMHSLEQIPWIFNLMVRSVTGRCSLRDSCR